MEESDNSRTATPFEKNLEVWRQLWRVIERSDIVVQIVDARNPLFYRSGDLETYVKEVGAGKQCLLVINKADFLTVKQRLTWADFFTNLGVEFLFFSAKVSQAKLEQDSSKPDSGVANMFEFSKASEDRSVVLHRAQLLTRFRQLHLSRKTEAEAESRPTQVGMVGFPNVGKSSVINVILGALASTHGKGTRAGVGATPGKTKHFQTLPISDEIVLCDCPGLVFPSFTSSRSEMVISGVVPIAQLRDYISPCQLICRRVPRSVLKKFYSLELPVTMKDVEDANGEMPQLDAHRMLEELAVTRGWMVQHRGGDESQAARILLKDFVTGKLVYCHPPPLEDEKEVDSFFLETFPEASTESATAGAGAEAEWLAGEQRKKQEREGAVEATEAEVEAAAGGEAGMDWNGGGAIVNDVTEVSE